MGVDIGVWRARIGSFNASVRRSSSKRAKQPVCRAGKAELEVAVMAVLLLIMAGGVEYSQHQNGEKCVFDVAYMLYTGKDLLDVYILISYSDWFTGYYTDEQDGSTQSIRSSCH